MTGEALPLLVVAPLAFVAALVFTPLARRLARATGYLDQPASRKSHTEPTPLLGGVAIAAALVAAPLLARALSSTAIAPPHPGLLAGAFVALALGLVDDRRALRPGHKLAWQLVAGACLVWWGTDVEPLRHNPLLGLIALVGVVTLLNAINFLDNMDGLVGALVPITACGFVALGLIRGAPVHLAVAWGLVGACGGFLVFNAPPARIFLGDAGSHLLGFALAALALQSLEGGATWPHVAALLLILSYPLFDVTFVVVDRILGRRPVTAGSVDHTTHRLRTVLGPWGTMGVVSLAVCLGGIVGVWVWGRSDPLSIVGALCVSALGYAVFGLFLRRIRPTIQFVT
ncbi:MAG: undecaprenyl/decaprenyl-phosphate alpha-N-acetylglucosaminyl 1-phosphate transferase [Candidatus Latescibacteria bacterium]|nr:undecaprenyl/decaprenyl-phosphate alpha-N-acetylglucosaminyl 1-phosphate transferase [Candidatus Latescibacterota bacterium]